MDEPGTPAAGGGLRRPQQFPGDGAADGGTRGRRHYVVATFAGLAIGFYDGILGPGTGSFLLIALVAGLGYSFLNASSTAKVVNLGTNIAALIVFGLTGSLLWLLGLLMGYATSRAPSSARGWRSVGAAASSGSSS